MYKQIGLKPTRYRRRKQTALSIAALFSSSSENEEDNSLPLNVKRIVPVHSETINLETTSLQNENRELHNSNNKNSSMETSESSISSVDSYEDPSLQSNESLEVSIASWAIRHSITHSALNDLLITLSNFPQLKH